MAYMTIMMSVAYALRAVRKALIVPGTSIAEVVAELQHIR
ncbi:hypothetical protein A2U01_0054499, partial [Trifolium medium]|nr:hypothetical protein [Trifolium medium]